MHERPHGEGLHDRGSHDAARGVREAACRRPTFARRGGDALHHVADLGGQGRRLQDGRGRLDGEGAETGTECRAAGDRNGAQAQRFRDPLHAGTRVGDLLPYATEPDDDRRSLPRPFREPARARHLEPERVGVRVADGERRVRGLARRPAGQHDGLLCGRPRADLEGGLDDHADRPERPDVQLREIVAGDVLDDPAPARDDRAVGTYDAEADQEVAHRAL